MLNSSKLWSCPRSCLFSPVLHSPSLLASFEDEWWLLWDASQLPALSLTANTLCLKALRWLLGGSLNEQKVWNTVLLNKQCVSKPFLKGIFRSRSRLHPEGVTLCSPLLCPFSWRTLTGSTFSPNLTCIYCLAKIWMFQLCDRWE